jgi:hypothetical protein
MMNGLTGLEYLTSVMQQTIPHAPMHELMHMKIAAVEYGKISVSIRPTPIAFSKHEAGAHQYPYLYG